MAFEDMDAQESTVVQTVMFIAAAFLLAFGAAYFATW